jgi:N-acetylmuramoyl-L-alanine amidase
MSKWYEIIIHHSGTEDGPGVSWGAIRKYHIEVNGWKAIGYNAGVELVGTSYEVLMGRPTHMTGAHTIGHNTTALGICFVGDFNKGVPPVGQLEAGAKKIKEWMIDYDIPKEKIFPHRKLNDTECPGKFFPMDKLLNLLG